MNPWEGISDQDRSELERLSLATGANLSTLRLGFRMGRIAGLDEAVKRLVALPPNPPIERRRHAL